MLFPPIDHSVGVTTYSKDDLARALRGATNWSTVNVRLGRVPDARSATLRTLAEEYKLDTSGIINPTARSYTDDALREAVEGAKSWADVREALGKPRNAGGAIASMRKAAKQLGIDVSHLDQRRGTPQQ